MVWSSLVLSFKFSSGFAWLGGLLLETDPRRVQHLVGDIFNFYNHCVPPVQSFEMNTIKSPTLHL